MNMIYSIVFIAKETDSKLMLPVQIIHGENFFHRHTWLLALRQTSDNHSQPVPIVSDLLLKYESHLPAFFNLLNLFVLGC